MSTEIEIDFSTLLPHNWKHCIDLWLQEDIPSFDYGGCVVGDKPGKATLYCKAAGVVAGVPFFTEVFTKLGCEVHWHVKEGQALDVSGGKINAASVSGPVRQILAGERLALNILARASGIASKAHALRNVARAKHWAGRIAGTRKTTPGFRLVEKYAMLVGGCDPHRMDLSSMIMLKDNHVKSTGSITAAVHKARAVGGFALKIEVECSSVAQALEAVAAGADVVMLDNFTPATIATAAAELRKQIPDRVLIEASGGITAETVADYMVSGVDIISMGTLTQGVPHVDFSLKIT